MEGQTTFLTHTPPKSKTILLTDIANSQFDCRPSTSFIRSIQQSGGPFTPIIVYGEKGSYKIATGRRRAMACKLAGIASLPAMVYRTLSAYGAARVGIEENAHRSPNPTNEAVMFKGLQDELGCDVKTLAKDLILPVNYVKRRLRLFELHEDAFEALKRAEITLPMAERMMRLPRSEQKDLVNSGNKVTGEMIENRIKAGHVLQVDALFDQIKDVAPKRVQITEAEDVTVRMVLTAAQYKKLKGSIAKIAQRLGETI